MNTIKENEVQNYTYSYSAMSYEDLSGKSLSYDFNEGPLTDLAKSHSLSSKYPPFSPGKGTYFGAIFIIVNSALGAGLLSFPLAFSFSGGVFQGVGLQIILACLMVINLAVIARATQAVRAYTYQQMVERLFGKPLGYFIQTLIIFYTFGSCTTYVVIIGDQVEKLFQLMPSTYNGTLLLYEQWYFSREIWMIGITLLFIAPLCMFRNISFLNWPSLIGVISCFYIALMALATYFIKRRDVVGKLSNVDEPDWHIVKILSALPVFCFGYQCLLVAVPVFAELKKRSIPWFVIVAIISIIICFVVYTLTGVFGYLSFGSKSESDIIKSYDPKQVLVDIARIGLLFAMITSFPLLTVLGRSGIDNFVVQLINALSKKIASLDRFSRQDGKIQLVRLQIESTIWIIISLTLACFIPDIEIIITPIGGVAALFSMVVPGFIQVKFAIGFGDDKLALWTRIVFFILGPFMVVVGAFIGAFSASQGVLNIVNLIRS